MIARHHAADALLQVGTVAAVDQALRHFTDMLRLSQSDNMGVRNIVPGLMLRLGREQECHDSLKRWALDDRDTSIRNADAFESADQIVQSGDLSLSQLAILTLLKLRLHLDLSAYEVEYGDVFGDPNAEPDRPVGSIVRAKIRSLDRNAIPGLAEELGSQYRKLVKAVNDENPHFWRL